MRKSNIKNKGRQAMLWGCFSIVCLSLIIMLFSIYCMRKVNEESDVITKKILTRQIFSMEILTSLINQETGVRAYIITEKKSFLEPYYLGSKGMQGYYNFLDNLKYVGLNSNTTNRLNQQMKSIQTFYKEQISLVDNGNSYEAKLNLDKGKKLVDEFKVTNNIVLNEIELNINSSNEKIANTHTIHKYLLFFLGIILIVGNYIFISYIWNSMHEKIKKKNEKNKDLQKILTSQEEYIVNISHELKTPLNVILSAAQLLDVYCDSGLLDEKKNLTVIYIDSIKRNSYRLSKLINNIIDLSKIESGLFELTLSNNNIVKVVEDMVIAVTEFTKSKGLRLIFDTDIEEKIITCDPQKIDKIVLNLISNAIKFSKVGGEIFVNIKNEIEFIEISVKDNGIGIEKKYLNTIFDKYNQVDKSLSRKSEGAGVGLSLVKSIVELAGGSINVESELGVGSKFIVKLPSKKNLQENIKFNDAIRSGKENIQVEFSDVY